MWGGTIKIFVETKENLQLIDLLSQCDKKLDEPQLENNRIV